MGLPTLCASAGFRATAGKGIGMGIGMGIDMGQQDQSAWLCQARSSQHGCVRSQILHHTVADAGAHDASAQLNAMTLLMGSNFVVVKESASSFDPFVFSGEGT